MLAIIDKLFGARYIIHEVDGLRKSKFFFLPFFFFLPPSILIYYISTATNIFILCNSGFFINILINIAIF